MPLHSGQQGYLLAFAFVLSCYRRVNLLDFFLWIEAALVGTVQRQGVRMRWEALFEDLEADVERIATAELAAEVADRTRRELARIRLVDRLREATGRTVTVAVAGHGPVAGVLADAGPDWLLLTADGGREVLLPCLRSSR